MAICLIFDGQNITEAQYEQVLNEVTPDNKVAPGMLYHLACTAPDGGWKVIEVWESQEAATRFFEEKLGAALQRANIAVQPEILQVHNSMQA